MTRPTELPFTYGVNQYTTTPWSFEQDVEHYTGAGVTVIEVCQNKLDRNPQSGPPRNWTRPWEPG